MEKEDPAVDRGLAEMGRAWDRDQEERDPVSGTVREGKDPVWGTVREEKDRELGSETGLDSAVANY
jgi:hypothetical protein